MTKLNWERVKQADRVRAQGGEAASRDLSSANFSQSHLQPTTKERRNYLNSAQQLLQMGSAESASRKAWIAKSEEFMQLVPPWVEDPQVRAAMNAVKSLAAEIRKVIDAGRTQERINQLREKIERLEKAVETQRFSNVGIEEIKTCCHLLDGLDSSVSKREKIRLRTAFRTAFQAIALDKLNHWEARGFPPVYRVWPWLPLIHAFAPELKTNPTFLRGDALPKTFNM
jgi:hypothetical protein